MFNDYAGLKQEEVIKLENQVKKLKKDLINKDYEIQRLKNLLQHLKEGRTIEFENVVIKNCEVALIKD